eukprot:g1910.t1
MPVSDSDSDSDTTITDIESKASNAKEKSSSRRKFKLTKDQIDSLREMFSLIDDDCSQGIKCFDLIEFATSHNLCDRSDALAIEEYVEMNEKFDSNSITFAQFASIAIAFDLIDVKDKISDSVLEDLDEESIGDMDSGVLAAMNVTSSSDATETKKVKRPSYIDQFKSIMTFKKTKIRRMQSVEAHFESHLLQSGVQNNLAKNERPWYIFELHDRRRLLWDVVILLLLSYTAVWIPVRVAFENPPGRFENVQALEVTVDIMFLLDVVVNFLTSYEDSNGMNEYLLRSIAWRYIKSWFLLDIVSSLPYDLMVSKHQRSSNLQSMFTFLKMLKLLRMFRAFRVFTRLEEELNLQGRRPMKLIKITVGVLFIMHLCACGWAFMARQGKDFYVDSWVAQANLVNENVMDEYWISLYWSVTTLTTVGYGDVSPVNNGEVIFATLAMIIGGALYGYVVALFATLMQGLDPNERIFNERMESIMCYMRHREFPQKLFKDVTRYYTHFYKYKTALDENAILDDLSLNLRRDVGEFLANKFFVKTYLFSKFPFHVLIQLLGKMMPIKTSPDEVVFRTGETGSEMYVLSIGQIFTFDTSGRIFFEYKPGAVFGEFCALQIVGGRLFHAQCRTMVEMWTITMNDLEDVFSCIPGAMDTIVGRARHSFSITVKKFGLQRRANMLVTLMKSHQNNTGLDAQVAMEGANHDIFGNDPSTTEDESEDDKEDATERDSVLHGSRASWRREIRRCLKPIQRQILELRSAVDAIAMQAEICARGSRQNINTRGCYPLEEMLPQAF